MPLSPGQILQERYRIDALIGQGGFGAVYRAWDLVQDRACACKENLDTRAAAVDQFGQEAVVLASLSHPNLPRVTDHFVLPAKGQYLVMDFVEGRNLASLMAEAGGALPEGELLPWIDQVCDALGYLHSQLRPIIHRDVKPQNIIITPAGRAMLVDFGTSKVADPGVLTRPAGRAVTPGFSPPEQYGLAGHTDVRSDIYALGATVYVALTGRVPPDSVDRLQGNASLVAPRQLRPEISRGVEAAMLKALEPHAAQRFQTIEELRHALAGRAATLPATRAASAALPVTRRAEAQAAGFRLPKGLLALGGVVLVAVAGLALYLGGVLPPRAPASSAGTPPGALSSSSETPVFSSPAPQMSRQPASGPAETPRVTASPAGGPAGARAGGPAGGPAGTPTGTTVVSAAVPTETAVAAPSLPATAAAGQAGDRAAPTPAPAQTAALPPIPTGAVRLMPTLISTPARIPAAPTAMPTRESSRNFVAKPGPTPLPELSALGPAVLYELFNSDAAGWPVEDSASEYQDWEVSFNRGRYRIADVALDDDVTIYSAAPEITLRDFLLETDATLIGSSGIVLQRLYFRCQDPSADNCYVADFYSNGEYTFGRTEAGEHSTLFDPAASQAIRTRPGETNTFAILATGSTFTLYANGQPLRAVSDRTHPGPGYFLLGVGIPHKGDDAVVEFDNFFVFQPAGQALPDPLPDEIAPAHVRLFERFSDNERSWDVRTKQSDLADSSYQVVDDVLAAAISTKATVEHGVDTYLEVPNLQLADFGLWVDTTFTRYTDVSEVYIIFRCQDEGSDDCCRVRFATDGTYAIGREQDNKYTALADWSESQEIRTGERTINNFGIVVRGSLVQVFANDVLLQSQALAGPTAASSLWLGVGTFDPGTQVDVQFDNLLVVEEAASP